MSAVTPVRVLVVDDQKVVREGLAMLLGLLDGIEVVGTAVDGADALRQVEGLDPDVVLMDLGMPVLDGVAATRQLAERGSRARVVVLTTYADDEWVFGALQAGARGFLTKDAGADEIRAAVLSVAAGDAQLDPPAWPHLRMTGAVRRGQRAVGRCQPQHPPLRHRVPGIERQVKQQFPELGLIGPHGRHFGGTLRLDSDRGRQETFH